MSDDNKLKGTVSANHFDSFRFLAHRDGSENKFFIIIYIYIYIYIYGLKKVFNYMMYQSSWNSGLIDIKLEFKLKLELKNLKFKLDIK